jgi:hypothetical protein
MTGVMIDIDPRQLSICRRRGSGFGVLYLSRSTSPFSVPTLITCCCALGCGVVAGCRERRGGAGGVCRCLSRVGCQRKACSRSPHRGSPSSVTCWPTRRVCPQDVVPVPVEVSPWTRWSTHRRRPRRDGQQMVLAGVID